jgi:dihydrodipicolinate synthase/N-acetylneuraminate lyase
VIDWHAGGQDIDRSITEHGLDQAAHSIHLAKCGIRGLVILGSTGEAVALTNKERSLLLSSVRKELHNAGFKDYPIIAGTATQGAWTCMGQGYRLCLRQT